MLSAFATASAVWTIVAIIAALLLIAGAFAYAAAHRLDRLHIRTDLAAAALRESLLRRHSLALVTAEALRDGNGALPNGSTLASLNAQSEPAPQLSSEVQTAITEVRAAALAARTCLSTHRLPGGSHHAVEIAENRLTRALGVIDREPLGDDLTAEFIDVGDRVAMARRFYNDAVRDTRRLRSVRVVRVFRLAGRAPMPEYIELLDPSYN